MGKVTLVARILLGLAFIVFGLDGLMRVFTGNGLFPAPPPSPAMATVMGGLMGMKYLFPLAKVIEFVSGILLVSNRYVNLAILMLTPVMVNILGINLFVDRSGAPIAIIFAVLLAIVIRDRWRYFRPLLTAK